MMTLTTACLPLLYPITCQEEPSNDTGSKAENLAVTAPDAFINCNSAPSILKVVADASASKKALSCAMIGEGQAISVVAPGDMVIISPSVVYAAL